MIFSVKFLPMNIITYFNSGLFFITVFGCTFAKIPGYQTEESIKLFKESYTFSFLCGIYQMSMVAEACLPVITVGSITLAGLSMYEDGKIDKKVFICSIPVFLGGTFYLVKKLMLNYLKTKYGIYERDIEVHLGLFIQE